MSIATKRKHVTNEVMTEFALPDESRFVAKVIASRGNNLHEVQHPEGETFLVSMPTKFRKNVWIKRGDFVMCEPIEEGDKVKAEISHILYKEQIKHIRDEGKWPTAFEDSVKEQSKDTIPSDMLPPSDSEDEDDLVMNPNRQFVEISESEDDSEEEQEQR